MGFYCFKCLDNMFFHSIRTDVHFFSHFFIFLIIHITFCQNGLGSFRQRLHCLSDHLNPLIMVLSKQIINILRYLYIGIYIFLFHDFMPQMTDTFISYIRINITRPVIHLNLIIFLPRVTESIAHNIAANFLIFYYL